MSKIHSYPKIFTIGTDYIRDIFTEEVAIEEKLDGSSFAFGNLNGTLHMRSKGAQLHPESPQALFKEGMDYIMSLFQAGVLPPNTIYYAEYLKKPKHNVLTYARIPKNHLMLFGLMKPNEHGIPTFSASRHDLIHEAAQLEIDVVPQLARCKVPSVDYLKSFMEYESFLGGCKIEGVVVKNYARPFLLGGQPIPLMVGKFVSEKFKEVHRDSWGKENTTKGKWDTFMDSFKTEARWAKAVQHLRESGSLTDTPKDIGLLIREVKQDIEAEEKDAIKDFLWKEFGSDLLRRAVSGAPEWYKAELAKRSFAEAPPVVEGKEE